MLKSLGKDKVDRQNTEWRAETFLWKKRNMFIMALRERSKVENSWRIFQLIQAATFLQNMCITNTFSVEFKNYYIFSKKKLLYSTQRNEIESCAFEFVPFSYLQFRKDIKSITALLLWLGTMILGSVGRSWVWQWLRCHGRHRYSSVLISLIALQFWNSTKRKADVFV